MQRAATRFSGQSHDCCLHGDRQHLVRWLVSRITAFVLTDCPCVLYFQEARLRPATLGRALTDIEK